jgi:hypothetical protein
VNSLTVAAWNCRGLRDKVDSVEELLSQHRIDLVFLSEIKAVKNTLDPRRYPVVKESGRHGIAVAVSDAIVAEPHRFHVTAVDPHASFAVVCVDSQVFCGVYLRPGLSVDQCRDILDRMLALVPAGMPVTLIGDWNMRVGAIAGDVETSGRGEQVLEWLADHHFVLCPFDDPRPTFAAPGQSRTVRSSIVDLAFCSADVQPSLVEIGSDNGGSDHFPIFLSVPTTLPPALPETKAAIAYHRLKREETAKKFIGLATPRLADLEGRLRERWAAMQQVSLVDSHAVQALLDETTAAFDGIVTASAASACGYRRRKGFRVDGASDPELRLLRTRRRHLLKAVNFYAGLGVRLDVKVSEELRSISRAVRKRVRKCQAEALARFCADIDAAEPAEQLRMVRRWRSKGKSTGTRLSVEGLPSYAEHFRKALAPLEAFHYEVEGPCPARLEIRPSAECQSLLTRCSPSALAETIKRAARGKAPGLSRVPVEALKPVSMPTGAVLATLSEVVVRTGLCPTAWSRAMICPVPKKTGSELVSDHRPISLTDTVRRIFERTILSAVSDEIGPLSVEQGGFRLGRSTLDQCAALQQVVSRGKMEGRPVGMAFMDIRAAYDTVDRQLLWRKCAARGMTPAMLAVLRGLFDRNESCVAVAGQLSSFFGNRLGLLQGSSLSPILYTVFMDDLIHELRTRGPTVQLGGYPLNSLWFADDIALVGTSREALQALVNVCSEHAGRNRYAFNRAKCEVIANGLDAGQAVLLEGAPLKEVSRFKYLGLQFTASGIDAPACFEVAAQSMSRRTGEFQGLGVSLRAFTMGTVMNIHRTFIRPIGEYGLAVMPFSAKAMTTLEGMHFRCMTRLLGISPMCNRKKLLAITGGQSMRERWESLSFAWAVNAMQQDASFIVHHALADYRRIPVAVSSFHFAHDGNSLSREYDLYRRAVHGQRDILTPRQFILKSRLQKAQELRSQFQDLPSTQEGPIAFRLDNATLPVDRRPILQWLLNCIPYAGRYCQRCQVHTISKTHIEACVGVVSRAACPLGRRTDVALKRAIEAEDVGECREIGAWLRKRVRLAYPDR